jgi:hypothetical protein
LTQDSAVFLDKRSPAYLGGAIDFLLSPMLTDGFKDLAAGQETACARPVWRCGRGERAKAPDLEAARSGAVRLVDSRWSASP